jgi:hypothetical protein
LAGDGGGKKWRDKFGGRCWREEVAGRVAAKGEREIRRCEREREKIWRENNGEKCQQISLVINLN